MFKNFSENEILNPVFDDCPAKSWSEVPENVQKNLIYTMYLVQAIRNYLGIPLKITSTWRPKDKGSPHAEGHAIDIISQPFVKGWAQKTVDWLIKQTEWKGFRIFWEFSGINEGWIHIDRNFRDKGENQFWIGFQKDKKMFYERYKNIPPFQKK